MKKKCNILLTGCTLWAIAISITSCGSSNTSVSISAVSSEHDDSPQNNENTETSLIEESTDKNNKTFQTTDASSPQTNLKNTNSVATDLKPSNGFAFESNGDGTCTIVGIGVCTDKDIVIPEKSPEGDTVTLIGEYALYNLEDINSITLVNYNYEVDKYAFQYSEFTTLNIIGGNPVLKKSAFSSCEDLTSIYFSDCTIDIDEYAFFSCGKKAAVTFSNCTGFLNQYSFQYGDFTSLTINNCELEIDKSAFSSCENLISIVCTDSTINAGEYAFFDCGDSAIVEFTNCSTTLDKYAFQYGSLETLTINGPKLEAEESAFSSCEDLTTVCIDCDSVLLGENAFYNCEDLTTLSIDENEKQDNRITIDDQAFQYCKRLDSVTIGNGNITIGEYAFSGCSDHLILSIAGEIYSADSIKNGLSQ